uniref:DUF4283 domain-containing protein n=1 Tax=Tanacetum cinerariifolium TaxID=118510 RepID=A0A6L2NVE5_TANCI|nr:hypothetical protein [Tanacetum cinerariifolium]
MNRGFLDSGGRTNNHRKKPSSDASTIPVTKSKGNDFNTSAGNAPGKSSYANATGKLNGKKLNITTFFTPGGRGNGIDVVVPVESIRAISDQFANIICGFFLGKRVAYPVVANYVRNTWGKFGLVRSMFSASTGLFSFQFSSMDGLDALLENGPWFIHNNPLILKKWHPDNIVVALPKIKGEGHYICNAHVEFEWKPSRYVGEKKIVKKPSQPSRGIPVGSKIGFKPQKEYRPVKKLTASFSGNKKKSGEPTIKVSNSNPFEVLNSVDNHEEIDIDATLGTNNVSSSNTPIGEKIDKIKRQICEGKLRFVDDDRNPLVPTGIVKSDSEVEVVFDENANLRISTSGKDGSDKGYGTNSLLE